MITALGKPWQIKVAFCLFLALASTACADPLRLRISAGAHERLDSPLAVALPAGVDLPPRCLLREGENGMTIPAQVVTSGDRSVLYVILKGTTAKGSERVFDVVPGDPAEAVTVHQGDGLLEVRCGDRKVLHYRTALVQPPAKLSALLARNAYIHPLWTPGGTVVTGDFAPDHPHQRGVFLAWTKTSHAGRHPDFWNLGSGKARVRFQKCEGLFNGSTAAGFRAHHAFEDLKGPDGPGTVIEEIWDVCVWSLGGTQAGWWLCDLSSTQNVIGDDPLVLPKYLYGGMAFRGNGAWHKGPCAFATSEGRSRADGNGTRGNWGDLSGETDGNWAGLALIGHPGNVRFPQPFRIHPQVPYFCFAPSQLGPWSIEPGKPLVQRYRMLIHDGKVDPALANRLFHDFADPPSLTVETSSRTKGQ